MANSDKMRAEDLEQEIAETRSRVDMTLDSIQRKLSAGQMLDEALQYLKSDPRGSRVRASMVENPLPVLALGAAAAWFAWSAFRAYDRDQREERWEGLARDAADEPYYTTPGVAGAVGLDEERPFSVPPGAVAPTPSPAVPGETFTTGERRSGEIE